MTRRDVLERGEEEHGYGVWKGDLYGVGGALGGKREKRGWESGLLEVVGKGKEQGVGRLLGWRGGVDGMEVFEGELLWDSWVA